MIQIYLFIIISALVKTTGALTTDESIAKKYLLPKDKLTKLASLPLPSKVDLCDKLPAVISQGYQGSCVAFASGYYYKTFQEFKEKNFDLTDNKNICSPAFVYNQINSGNDDGSFPLDALRLLRTSGCASLSDMPYNPNDITTLPSKEQMMKALPNKSDDLFFFYHRGNNPTSGKRTIPLTDTEINAMKGHLNNGDIFVISIPSFYNLYDVSGNFYDLPNNFNDPQTGGHALVVCGYDDSVGNGKGGFRIKNSWGTDWAENGLAYLSYNFMRNYSAEAMFMTDRINYTPKTVADIDINNIPRTHLKMFFLGNEGKSPVFDFLSVDLRKGFNSIVDLSDLSFENNNILFNMFDIYEDENIANISKLTIKDYQTGEEILNFNNKLPLNVNDFGDVDFTTDEYYSLHYDLNGLDYSTMGGIDNKIGYLGVFFRFVEEGTLSNIDFYNPHQNTKYTLTIYEDIDVDFKPIGEILTKEGMIEQVGWHSIAVIDKIYIKNKSRYYVVIKYENEEGSVVPIDSFYVDKNYSNSYYSKDGTTFEQLEYSGKIRVRVKKGVVEENDVVKEESSCGYSQNDLSLSNLLILLLIFFIFYLNRSTKIKQL